VEAKNFLGFLTTERPSLPVRKQVVSEVVEVLGNGAYRLETLEGGAIP